MTTEKEIFEFLKGVLLNFLDIAPDDITPETRVADLSMESLDFVELQLEIVKTYKTQVRPAVFESGEVKTISDFARYIANQLQPQGAVAASA